MYYITKVRHHSQKQKWVPGHNMDLTDVLALCANYGFFETVKIPGDIASQSIILNFLLERGEFIELGDTLIIKKI